MELTMDQLKGFIGTAVGEQLTSMQKETPAAVVDQKGKVVEFAQDFPRDQEALIELFNANVDGSIEKYVEKKQEEDPDAKMESILGGTISSLDGALGQGIPWGSAIAGGFFGLLTSELIDGFVDRGTSDSPNMMNSAAKLGGAFLNVMFQPKLTNKLSGQITAGVLIFQVLAAHLPISDWVSNITGFVPGQSTTGFKNRVESANRMDQFGPSAFAGQLPYAPAGQQVPDPLSEVLSGD